MSHLLPDQESDSGFLDNSDSLLPMRSITVLIVDDHALVRAAINQTLSYQPEIKCVVEAQDYTKAEEQVAKLSPDIILLDIHIARSDGIAEICHLRKISSDSHIMVLADVENEREAFAAIMAGAQGYRSKQDVDPNEVMAMIRTICQGEFVLRPALLTLLMRRFRDAALPVWGSVNGSLHHTLLRKTEFNELAQLTAREREILQLISQGYRDREIAEGLYLSEKTVQKHVQSILSKLGVGNRTKAAYLIHHQGIL